MATESLGIFGLDLETALIKPGRKAPPITCCAMGPRDSVALFGWYDHELPRLVFDALNCPDLRIVGHNIAFDMATLASEYPELLPSIFSAYRADRIGDTMIRQKLCDIAGGVYKKFDNSQGQTVKIEYSLAAVAKRHLGLDMDKDTWRLRYGEFRDANIPIEQWPSGAREYPIGDVETTLDVYQVQTKNAKYLEDEYRQTRAAFWIQLMEIWGLRTDPRGVAAFKHRVDSAYRELEKSLQREGIVRPNGSRDVKKTAALVEAAYLRIGKECPRTDTGAPSTAALTCEESGDDMLIDYAELSSLKMVISKDYPILDMGTHEPIHSRFESLKETGRTGSAAPNVQNLRKSLGMRECFAPPCLKCGHVSDVRAVFCERCHAHGTVFVAADYGGLELSTFAQVCYSLFGYSYLGDALNAGKDAHLIVAANLISRDYDELYHIRKTYDKRHPEFIVVDNARQSGKIANFGYAGGCGAATFKFQALKNYGVRISLKQAQDLKDVWLRTWKETTDYFRYIGQVARAPMPMIEQLFAKRFRGWRHGMFTEICNSPFQGLGSDIAKAAGFEIAEKCYVDTDSALYGCRTLLMVHDEFALAAPRPRAHDCAIELQRTMVEAAKPWLPNVRIDAEPVIMTRYSHDAKQIWNNGRLEAWSPEYY